MQLYNAGGTIADLSDVYSHGIEDYNSTDGSQSISNGSHTTLVNNGLGAFTNLTYKIPGRANMWDTGTDRLQFDVAGLVLGDTVEIRMDLLITTSGANRDITFGLTLAEGGFPYDLTVGTLPFKNAGTYSIVKWISVYMGDTNTLENPALIWIESDGAGDSVVYNGHMLRTALRQPVVAV
jgi:hypothetical protein